MLSGEEYGRDEAAARCIQRHWRGWQARQEFPGIRDEAVAAAILIQKHARVRWGLTAVPVLLLRAWMVAYLEWGTC